MIVYDVDWGWQGLAEDGSFVDPPEYAGSYGYSFAPVIQPGDTVVLGEEWWEQLDGKQMLKYPSTKYHGLGWQKQPASAMPAELARFRCTAGKSIPNQKKRDGVWGWVIQLTRKENEHE